MTTLAMRTNPLTDILDWLESETSLPLRGTTHFIKVEDYQEDGAYVVRAELPGVDPEKNVEITVTDDVLTIQGRRQEGNKDKHHSEFRYGSFTRSLRLPPGAEADKVTAGYHDGVLEIRVPAGGDTKQAVTTVPVERH